MANDLTRKIMANIAAKSIPVHTAEGSYGNISANDEAALTELIHGGRKPAVALADLARGGRTNAAAPARPANRGSGISLAALAQQKRHG